MKSKKLSKSQGFTIIETLIVLAIAATIFLVVFLAVSALNRSSRNTQRKDDAGGVVAGFSEYASNNSGALPSFATWAAPNLTLCNIAGCGGTDAQTQVKLGYYTQFSTTISTKGEVYIGASLAVGAATDALDIITGATCNGTAPIAGGTRSVAAVYGIESGASGNFTWQCQSS
jgi:prepilin-type N-terminal cleavage/methylation domain-containing protein